MRQTNIIKLFWVLVVIVTSCIIPYEPHISRKDINKFVVSGQVTNNNEYQTVSVSMASSVSDPQYIPVPGCYVRIQDKNGNEFLMEESEEGIYRVRIDKSYLHSGNSFKVDVLTPDGVSIESDFDTMSECPEIDSVYFMRRDLINKGPGRDIKGIQFYVNIDARNIDTRFFRWEIIETWEYHAAYHKEWYYDGTVHRIVPADYSRKVCWSTELIKNIYTLSTFNLIENRYQMFPLNFVGNRTSRLAYGYSMLISQFGMSEPAYSYWDQLRINSGEQGGLYEKQPLAITGNLHNKTHPDNEVLGFFSVSSVTTKRIFIKNVENLVLDFSTYCKPESPGRFGLREIDPSEYPAYLMKNVLGQPLVILSITCVDCTKQGGTTIKPDFWPY